MQRILLKSLLVSFCCFFPFFAWAQKIVSVEATYIYYAPENVTLEQAKHIALERAQLEALAEAFGTVISQHNSTRISNANEIGGVDFLGISSSDVKGEWIETTGEPEYDIFYEQQMLVVKCHLRGKARQICHTPTDLKVKVLRNGMDDRHESLDFKDGDDMYLSFQSPIDGYLAVYLIDYDSNAYCLLPYRNQTDGIYKVKANTPYVFFSEKMAPIDIKQYVDEYILTCQRTSESNLLCVVFSPSPFVKALDDYSDDTHPRELTHETFQKWCAKQKQMNSNVITINYLLTIKK